MTPLGYLDEEKGQATDRKPLSEVVNRTDGKTTFTATPFSEICWNTARSCSHQSP
jgi:hypothetical protein